MSAVCPIDLLTQITDHITIAPVAQWIEHLTTDQEVTGSTPVGRTSFDLPFKSFPNFS